MGGMSEDACGPSIPNSKSYNSVLLGVNIAFYLTFEIASFGYPIIFSLFSDWTISMFSALFWPYLKKRQNFLIFMLRFLLNLNKNIKYIPQIGSMFKCLYMGFLSLSSYQISIHVLEQYIFISSVIGFMLIFSLFYYCIPYLLHILFKSKNIYTKNMLLSCFPYPMK